MTPRSLSRRRALLGMAVATAACMACSLRSSEDQAAREQGQVIAAVQDAVWSFHAADTARDAEAVIQLMWPDFTMLADDARLSYDQAAAGAREFMGALALFHTVWTDLHVIPLGQHAAVASFRFRDSIVTKTGELIRNGGTTTFVWQHRDGEWRLLFADAHHRPVP